MRGLAIYNNGADDDGPPRRDSVGSDWVRWLLGGLLAALVACGTAWLNHVQGEIDKNRDEVHMVGNKISRIEVTIGHLEKQIESLNAKMDRLLDWTRGQDAKRGH